MIKTVELTYDPTTAASNDQLTHRIFRYPAKFHAPVVRELLRRYTREGSVVLDPFVGSGTLLIEARTLGRSAVGLDVDPVAVMVARVKSHRYQPTRLEKSARSLQTTLENLRRPDREYEARKFKDISESTYRKHAAELYEWIPPIPNLFHWFRRYVIIDLARIRRSIANEPMPQSHRDFLTVLFGSIIRNASNADPVPVSGLEVTAHMRRRETIGRIVNPFALMDKAVAKGVVAAQEFASRARPETDVSVLLGDATRVGELVQGPVDAVITSPPYHGAVDYYRRHQLEMYWMGLVDSAADRQQLLQSYIGRPKVARSHPLVSETSLRTGLAKEWEQRIREVSTDRADAFHHYIAAMCEVFDGLSAGLPRKAPMILVVGHSSWNDSQIPTTELFEEISGNHYVLHEVLTYAVKNRYMSYARHNGANIDREYVLDFRRR